MRTVKYLSPSSIRTWEEDRSEFYLRYLADERPPRMPQTRPMAVGAAFDAFIKSKLVADLFGEKRPQFELKTIFEAQVEPHNRDWARLAGAHVYTQYVKSGALTDLMLELSHAIHEPRFELTVTDEVAIGETVPVPLLGKPDVYFITRGGEHVIYDWKVNGYCSKSPTSPKPGYIMLRGEGRNCGKAHKSAQVINKGGIDVNVNHPINTVAADWATQLAIYSWILGESVGAQFIAGIDQIVGGGMVDAACPLLRFATHRGHISADWQKDLASRIAGIWAQLQTPDPCGLGKERMEVLDIYYKAYEPSGRSEADEQWFKEITRG